MAADHQDMPTPPGRKPRRTAPARRPLSRDLIVGTAIRILDAEGLEAVSMRRVAQELGTGPASLYAHVSGREELRELMLDHVLGEVRLPEPDPARWQEQLRELALEIHRVYLAHRDIAAVSLGAIPTGPNMLDITETQLALMVAGGVPRAIAGLAVDTLAMFVDADAIEGAVFLGKVPPGEDPVEHLGPYFEQIRDYMKALPAARYPHISGMADELTGGDGEDRFQFGIDILIRGIASYARP